MRNLKPGVWVVFVLLSCATLWGQTGQVTGSIIGVIRDPSQSAVPNASIRAQNLATGFERDVQSDGEGHYEIPLLPVGVYRVTVRAPGFEAYEQSGVEVQLARASTLHVPLRVGQGQQVVSVQADATILNTLSSGVEGTVNQRSLVNLPITSRNTFNLALLAPGFNGTRDDEFGNPTFAFGGMQRRAFLVDGVDNTQRGGPGRLGIFAPETIQEVKVISNSMDAEYGRTVGGIISMVTRGGTNDLHGAALVLERRPALIARPSLAATKPFDQWAVYSGNLGGPIKNDKLFYFVGGEYEPLDDPRPITITPRNAAALGLPASDLGAAPFGQRFQTYLGRLDYQLNPANNFYFRYSNFVTPSKYNTSGGLTARSASNNFDDRNDTFSSQWTSILNPAQVNELRFGFLRREFKRPPVNGVVGPIISISNVATFGSNTSAAQYYNEQQFNFIDHFTYRAGPHSVKLGADVDTVRVISRDRLLLQYSFSSVSQYVNTVRGAINPATGRPFNYTQLTQDFGNNSAQHRTNPINFFVQDDYRILPNWTLYYGIRWEYRVFPSLDKTAPLAISQSIPSDPLNFAPRLGFAGQLNQKTVLRGGYGVFYDTLNLRLISQVYRQNGSRVLRYVVNGNSSTAPIYPNALTAPNAAFASRPSVTGFAAEFKTQYAHQANLQIERELARDLALTVGVQWYGGHREPLLIDTNLGPPVGRLADGRPVFSNANRPNPNFNQIFALQSVGNSTYYGGYLALNKRFSAGFQFTASYTLGYAFNENDSTGDAGSNVSDSTNVRRDYGPSSSDQRHRFVFQGVWQPRLPVRGFTGAVINGWTIAPDATVTSAFPINVGVGNTDLNGDSVLNDRPLFRGRNDTPGYMFRELNLRLSRTFPLYRERIRLEIIGEAENLLNSTNAACSAGGCTNAVVNQFNAPNFKQITSAFNSRQIQLGGRLRF